MAEGKKSFVAYADWKEMFDALPDELAGKLIKHIFAYVNDENPDTDDFVIKAVFAQVKTTLKRDLKKWEDIRENRSLSGRLGNLKRWHLDLYDLYNAGKINIDEAEKIAKERALNSLNRKVSHSDIPQSQDLTNIAVNCNMLDVNVSTKVDVVEESPSTDISKKLDGSFAETEAYRKEIENNINTMKSQVSWKTDIAKAHGLSSLEDADFWIDQYRTHILTISKPDVGISELKRHFNNWLRKQDKTKIVSIQRPMTPQEKREARSKRFN